MAILQQVSPANKSETPSANLSPESLGGLVEKTRELGQYVVAGAAQGLAVHDLEKGIWQHLLGLGREALAAYFALAGDGDQGPEVELPDGRRVRRLAAGHSRPYQSIFGEFELTRVVYGTREGQKIADVPLDPQLELPRSKFSYLLQDWSQRLAVDASFTQVSQTLEEILGASVSVDSLERMNRKMAEFVVDHWDQLAVPPRSEEGEVLVLSADGKGVPLRRRSATQSKINGHQPSPSGHPRKGKKMALLGAAYSIDGSVRSPEEVVESLFSKPGSTSDSGARPRPQHKRVRASLARDAQDKMQPAIEEIFGWMAVEAELRRGEETRPVVLLMDGQTSLWDAAPTYLPSDRVEILDLLHVTPRLWKLAHLFHPKGSASAAQLVRSLVSKILEGRSRTVISSLRRKATVSGLKGRKRKELERICKYFENNRERMLYDQYLAAGYPIATGVIEGACRNLVKDRLERAGMRWVLDGAQAMLDLRSIHLADQWDAFQAFRIRQETESLYPHANQNDRRKWPLAA